MTRSLDEEREARNARAEEGGGAARMARQERLGRWSARKRIAELVDAGSFSEIGKHALHRSEDESLVANRHPGDGVVCGTARVRGRGVAVIAHDPTVLRGALGGVGAKKIVRLMELAATHKLPVVTLADGDGARIAEGVDAIDGYGSVLAKNVEMQGIAMQLTLVAGLAVGAAAYSAALNDWVAMVEAQSYMFITGAKVTRVVMGEEATMDDLGGADMHAKKTGQCHALVASEAAGIEWLVRMLSFLEAWVDTNDDPARTTERIANIIPEDQRKPYDVRQVLEEIVDRGTFHELGAKFGAGLVTALARLGGHRVALVASQPLGNAGCLDIDASRKGEHFISFCGREGIPILTFVDIPGYLPGLRQEQGGIVPIGATLIRAYGQAHVPRICLVLRKCYGGGTCLSFASPVRFALPTARVAPMGADATLEVLYGPLPADASPEEREKHEERKRAWLDANDHAWAAAEDGYLDDVLAAKDVRRTLHATLANLLAGTKRGSGL